MPKKQQTTKLLVKEPEITYSVDEKINEKNDIIQRDKESNTSGDPLDVLYNFEFIDKKYGSHSHFKEISKFAMEMVSVILHLVDTRTEKFESRIEKYKYMCKIQDELQQLTKENDELHMRIYTNLTRMKFMVAEIDQIKSDTAISELDNVKKEFRSSMMDVYQGINEKYNEIYKKEFENNK